MSTLPKPCIPCAVQSRSPVTGALLWIAFTQIGTAWMQTHASATHLKGSARNLCGQIMTRPQPHSQRLWTPLETLSFSTVKLGSATTAMAAKSKRKDGLDFENAAKLLEEHWQTVTTEAIAEPDHEYVGDKALRE